MDVSYDEQWLQEVNGLKQRVESEIDLVIDQNIKVLTDTVNLKLMEEKYGIIERIMSDIQEG